MNYKTKFLNSKEVDAVRDKTLSFGCLIDWGDWGKGIKGRTTQVRPMKWFDQGDDGDDQTPDEFLRNHKNDKQVKVIGHPLNYQDLLRLLDKQEEQIDINLWGDGRIEILTFDDKYNPDVQVLLPLNHNNLEEIPEDWEGWKQLCEIINLK